MIAWEVCLDRVLQGVVVALCNAGTSPKSTAHQTHSCLTVHLHPSDTCSEQVDDDESCVIEKGGYARTQK